MRKLVGSMLLLVLLAPALSVRAEEEQGAEQATREALPEPTHDTSVKGDASALLGRWLVVVDIGQGGRAIGVASFWEVEQGESAPVLVERFVNLPEDMQSQMREANRAGEPWRPTAADIARIGAEWDALPTQKRGVAQVGNEFWSQDAFDDDIKSEPKTRDALWVVRQNYTFAPGGQRPVKQVNVYSALTPTDAGGFSGTYEGVTLAAAAFMVPIPMRGTFEMTPIPTSAPPAQGLLARIGALFRGCAR